MEDPSTDRTADELRLREAESLMRSFAARTAIAAPGGLSRRYLWTDAFAVCNFLGLYRATGSPEFFSLAETLVVRVHEALGRHRPDSGRAGWISGLPEGEGRLHPTRGGLRIGKPLPERRPGEPYDDRLEWERDGQYFHYLTRWMHALARMAAATSELRQLEWAIDLAEVAHDAFTFTDARGRRRMYWKTSIDLRRPLVPSMGHHDPLDGLLACLELRASLAEFPLPGAEARLDRILDDFAAIAEGLSWTTDDPLGIGGLLTGAGALAQLAARGTTWPGCSVPRLLADAANGLAAFRRQLPLGPANRRLPFRELGLAIGLHAVRRIDALAERHREALGRDALDEPLRRLRRELPLAAAIEEFWLDPANRGSATWTEHRDIDEVMLATSLAPDGYLEA